MRIMDSGWYAILSLILGELCVEQKQSLNTEDTERIGNPCEDLQCQSARQNRHCLATSVRRVFPQ